MSSRIRKNLLSFWSHIIKKSITSIFRSEETSGKILESIIKWGLSLIAGFGVIIIGLGSTGVLENIGTNAITYVASFISGLILRFFVNLVTIPANLYFEARGVADKLSWEDVKSSVWKEPVDKPVIVGIRLEREEHHSVQSMRAMLRTVVKDGKIWFNGYGEYMLPIRKSNGVIAWMKSFDHEKPRNIMLASISGEKLQIKLKKGNEEEVREFDIGTYDVEIGFTAEGGVEGHVFRGLLRFDGKSIDLDKI